MDYQIINHIFSSALFSYPILFEIFALIGIITSIWLAVKILKVIFRLLAKLKDFTVDNWPLFLFVGSIMAGMTLLVMYSNNLHSRPEIGTPVILKGIGSIGTVVKISDDNYDKYTTYTIEYLETVQIREGDSYTTKKKVQKKEFKRKDLS